MNDDERVCAIALALTDKIGWTLLHRLLDQFGTLGNVLAATPGELRRVRGIGPHIAARIAALDLEAVRVDLRRMEAQSITAAIWLDVTYPKAIMQLDDRPLVMFWKGTLRTEDRKAVSIVGTREPSRASVNVVSEWAEGLAQRGWTVVSGLARGIDTAAHVGALAGGGRTIAVLGCGINDLYPPENRTLATQIIQDGALLCEVHPDATPSPGALMRRNRLIAALGLATIVVEAPVSSGALHAARSANSLGRPVFAIDNSAGNAALLQDYARTLPESVDRWVQMMDVNLTP